MKKILALFMAAMLVLTAVSALAAGSPTSSPVVMPSVGSPVVMPSVGSPVTAPSVEEAYEPIVIILDDQSSAEALAAEMSAVEYDAAVLSEETQAAIGEAVKEMVATELVALRATRSDEAVVVTFAFVTTYTADQAVATVLKVADAEIVLENTVNEDGSLAVSFTNEALAALVNNSGVLVVLSK